MAQPDAWLRGPIEGVESPYLMPVAHALVQAVEDVEGAAAGLTTEQLWARPGGAAAVGFHLRHIPGVVERLLTYARGEQLSPEQLAASQREGEPGEPPETAEALLAKLRAGIDRAMEQIKATPTEALLEPREVGRKRIPSNVLGLLFHAAEHAQRHTGQTVATAKVVRAKG
ncbi:MAG TPA: DinB family protein [Longimicrobiaceae bacterium]|nr:DinB family protein [Longimicrobiaceae bacterium]